MERHFPWLLTRLFRPGPTQSQPGDVISLCHALLSERGEVSGARRASEAAAAYNALPPADQQAFFDKLVEQFSPDPGAIAKAASAFDADRSDANFFRLQEAVEPRRQELFRRFNMAAGGTATLVRMRRNLLAHIRENPRHVVIDADLAHLFRSWFNRGFLTLQRIDWHTSAVILERLIQYEAVHQIQGWTDLRRRLEADRRCYAFFHSALPDEPLIFIEIALTRGLAAKVQPLIDPNSVVVDPALADTAIFYSITNCQEGLRGISFGNLLIKQVVEDLGRTFPRIRRFATLSPIPGFRRWLESPATRSLVSPAMRTSMAESGVSGPDHAGRASLPDGVRDELLRLCAYYLICAKNSDGPLDSVARFHLANGAGLERLNWGGDTSSVGVSRSYGLTANYLYRLSHVEQNHEAYATSKQVVATRALARQAEQVKTDLAQTSSARAKKPAGSQS